MWAWVDINLAQKLTKLGHLKPLASSEREGERLQTDFKKKKFEAKVTHSQRHHQVESPSTDKSLFIFSIRTHTSRLGNYESRHGDVDRLGLC